MLSLMCEELLVFWGFLNLFFFRILGFNNWSEKGSRDSVQIFPRRVSEDGARFFSGVPSNRTRRNSHKLKHKKFLLSMMKNFFQ